MNLLFTRKFRKTFLIVTGQKGSSKEMTKSRSVTEKINKFDHINVSFKKCPSKRYLCANPSTHGCGPFGEFWLKPTCEDEFTSDHRSLIQWPVSWWEEGIWTQHHWGMTATWWHHQSSEQPTTGQGTPRIARDQWKPEEAGKVLPEALHRVLTCQHLGFAHGASIAVRELVSPVQLSAVLPCYISPGKLK